MYEEYSPYKMLHFRERLKERKPIFVQWSITHRCNMRCIFCTNRNQPEYCWADQWKLEDIKRVAKQLREFGILAIEVTGGGEPTLHPDFREIHKTFVDLGFKLSLITNGSRLHLFEDLLEEYEWIRISIDAHSPQTYKRIKGVEMPDFSLVRRIQKPIVGASFVVIKENVKEIAAFARWAKEMGFDNCRFSYNHDLPSPDYYEPILGELKEQLQEAKREETENFRVFTLEERLKIWQPKKYHHCYYSDLVFAISGNGFAYRCCEWINRGEKGKYGNLIKRPIWEIWGERKDLDPAKDCPPCWMDAKNEFGAYLVLDNPKHKEFI